MRRMVSLLLSGLGLLAQPAGDALARESRALHDRLIQEGYNLTYGLSFGRQGEQRPLQVEFLVPPGGEVHRMFLWLKTPEGEATVRLRRAEGTEVFQWSGQEGEMRLMRRLAAGRYFLEVVHGGSGVGWAEFAVKGRLLKACKLEGDSCSEVRALPAQGFHWPYLLYIPRVLKAPHLLVVPNNTGYPVEDLELIRASGTCEVQRQMALADRLGCPLLVPLFPRPILDPADPDAGNVYLHALSRAALETERPEWRRVDLQLQAMIEDARARLASKGWPLRPKVLLSGFSAAGMFVNRYAFLHPDQVLAVACGSPGGWPLAPVDQAAGTPLPYPVGCADLASLVGRSLDREGLRKVGWFFYLGEEDRNDAVVCRDGFSKADEALVFRHGGATLPERWRKAEALYGALDLPATFRLYPRAGHAVNAAMAEDLAHFFEAQLGGVAAQR